MRLLLWPFELIWQLVSLVLGLTGRLVTVLLGVAFIAIGLVLCLTIVGAIVGIPLILLGLSLVLRGMF